MSKVSVWVPVKPDDLPVGLGEALQLANKQPKRNWAVCQRATVILPDAAAAEIARLKQQVSVLQRQLNLYKQKGEVVNVEAAEVDVDMQVRQTVRQGKLVSCTKEEYPRYRQALHKFAAWAVDNGQAIYANISLNEVRRLDRLHGFEIGEEL